MEWVIVMPSERSPNGMIVIVTGGRTFGIVQRGLSKEEYALRKPIADRERDFLWKRLNEELEREPALELWHGAADGADNCADNCAAAWARYYDVAQRGFPALWELHGRSAGPRRNGAMVRAAKEAMARNRLCGVVVLAFPGGAGTADMSRQSAAAGLHVVQVPFGNVQE